MNILNFLFALRKMGSTSNPLGAAPSYVTGSILTPVSYTHLDVYKRQSPNHERKVNPTIIIKYWHFTIFCKSSSTKYESVYDLSLIHI